MAFTKEKIVIIGKRNFFYTLWRAFGRDKLSEKLDDKTSQLLDIFFLQAKHGILISLKIHIFIKFTKYIEKKKRNQLAFPAFIRCLWLIWQLLQINDKNHVNTW